MDILLIGLLVVVVVIERRRSRSGRTHVRRWAADNGVELQSCRYRYLRLHRRPQFNVVVRTAGGRVRRGVATVAGADGTRTRVDLGEPAAA